jgi:hypothetical protein
LLSAIEICKEYRNILLGYHQPIINFKGHTYNFNGLSALNWVLRWFFILEKYGAAIEYIPRKINVAVLWMLYTVLTMIAWRFKKKHKHLPFSHDKKNHHQSDPIHNSSLYYLYLQRTSKSQGTIINRKGLSSTSSPYNIG